MKTKSEAKVLETDAIIFPTRFGQNAQEPVSTDDTKKIAVIDKDSNETGNENRFARLRKSLRKRSASIL